MFSILPNNQSALDELLFQHRNKAYGAYTLRKNYSGNLLKGLVIASIAFTGFIFLLFFFAIDRTDEYYLYKSVDYKTTNFSMEEVVIPKLNIEQSVEKSTKSAKIESANENLVPVPTEQAREIKPSEKSTNTVAQTTTDAEEKNTRENAIQSNTTQLNSVSADTTGTTLYTNDIYMKVETNAEFAGGVAAFEKFIQQNIKLPPYAIANKINGLIYVHIVVNRDGSISDLKLYKGIEQSCNEEVLRVMQLSPNWIPARKDGNMVRQRLIVPVRFEF